MRRGAVISVPGLGYTSMARCSPRFLMELFNYSPRGVMHFPPPRTPEEAWRRTFGGLGRSLGRLGVEIVAINPPGGSPRGLAAELAEVERGIMGALGRSLPIASVNSIAYSAAPPACDEVGLVDGFLSRIFRSLDEYMIISPFGDRVGDDFEEYGIYLSSVERPGHEDVIAPEQIPDLVAELAARVARGRHRWQRPAPRGPRGRRKFPTHRAPPMEYKWRVWSVTMVGSLMSAIDGTIVVLAILPIAEDLHTDYITMVWVVVAYLLVNTALVLSLGRMGDMYGRKRMYNAGFIVFIIGSALSGLAPNGLSLVAFRAIQGMGAALLTANSFALISQAFPPQERGKAFGMNSIVWGAGSVLGIVLGGLIITYTTWRAIFLINVPIGIFGTLWAYRAIMPDSRAGGGESFDLVGAGTFTAGLLSLLLAFTWGLLYSWSDPYVYAFVAASLALFASFAVWEAMFSADPIVDFSLFRNRIFSFSVAVAMLQSLALFAVNFLLMFYFEGIAGVPILTAAYLLLPMSIMSMSIGPYAGRLSDRVGARVVATAGLLVQAAALYMLSGITPSTPLLHVAALEAIYGAGGGMFWPANTSAIMSSSPPRRYGVASGVMNMMRNTGMVLSFIMALTAAASVLPAYIVYELFIGTLSGRLPSAMALAYLRGQEFAFRISVALLIASAAMSLVRGRHYFQSRADGRA
ncbi:MAG: MFS transporter [Nitrososphaeria archaeon]